MVCPVLDLIRTRFFVLLDQPGFVLVERAASNNAGLLTATILYSIYIKCRLVFGKENAAVNELL